jgi:hypothetical protein
MEYPLKMCSPRSLQGLTVLSGASGSTRFAANQYRNVSGKSYWVVVLASFQPERGRGAFRHHVMFGNPIP